MYFNKFHHPANFRFPYAYHSADETLNIGDREYVYKLDDLGNDVYRLQVLNPEWPRQYSQAELETSFSTVSRTTFCIGDLGALSLCDEDGTTLIRSLPEGSFGVCGKAWLMQFKALPGMQFYGMGEKTLGFELSGAITKFWNADVCGDFDPVVFTNGRPDPMYVSIPYLIIKLGNRYLGILINNPYAIFMSITSNPHILEEESPRSQNFYLGAPDGLPELFFIVGPSLSALTRKLQHLCGTTPLPPLWALGYHQSRWGYARKGKLSELDQLFREHEIPCDGLWWDIDAMDGYRVFTFHPDRIPDPEEELKALHEHHRHIVPILDPGIKLDDDFPLYRDGLEKDIFCQGQEGKPFVGFVWPGETVFPDFSIPEGRDWWAEKVSMFVQSGIDGAWLDMNEPSTGFVENEAMCFGRGQDQHATFHNQYALGMAKATREGFLKAKPKTRPFLLSRSGFISSSRYAGVWTGDNHSNEHHLRMTIPLSLNLALSGIPFNGPDVPGFNGDADAALAVAWYKACFLFPFFRNHSHDGVCQQEPWAFNEETLAVTKHYIQLRYKLLPYLYNLFIRQEEDGEAILRPLFYDFEDSPSLPLGKIDDQFMIGPAIMQAPVLEKNGDNRQVVLPSGKWFDAQTGAWLEGGFQGLVEQDKQSTPIFVREGSIIPMLVGSPIDNKTDLSTIECHIFLSDASETQAKLQYRFDDGISFEYRYGKRTQLRITAEVQNGCLRIEISDVIIGYKPCRVRFVTYHKFDFVRLNLNGHDHDLVCSEVFWRFSGKIFPIYTTPEIPIK
jgi:alpha-glucosidase